MTVTLALCSYKGGTGKTTLAYNLAERASCAGYSVSLLDFDPQEGSVGLASLRSGDTPWEVRVGQASAAGAESLEAFRSGSVSDVLVCDMPGWDSMAVARLLAQADLVLSPVGTGPNDLLAAANFQWMSNQMHLDAWYVPNLMPVGRVRRQQLMRELSSLTPPASVVPVAVLRRVVHPDSLRRGWASASLPPTAGGPLRSVPCGSGSPAGWASTVAATPVPELSRGPASLFSGFIILFFFRRFLSMAKEESSLVPIQSVRQRRAGEPLPTRPALSDSPPLSSGDYDHPSNRNRPKPNSAGNVKCSITLPQATRVALERARIEEDMRPLSSIVNQAVVEYLERSGVILDS